MPLMTRIASHLSRFITLTVNLDDALTIARYLIGA